MTGEMLPCETGLDCEEFSNLHHSIIIKASDLVKQTFLDRLSQTVLDRWMVLKVRFISPLIVKQGYGHRHAGIEKDST